MSSPIAFSQAQGDIMKNRVDLTSIVDSKAATFAVIDGSTGQPIAGACIKAENAGYEAVTDDNGIALMQIPASYRSVEVKAKGFRPLTMPLKYKTLLTVTLVPEIETPAKVPGARATDRIGELMGTLYSVERPGGLANGSAIFIDGVHSLNSSSQPLYIIDGQPVQGGSSANNLNSGYGYSPLALIDPDNIKSIKVLKDGAALYGPKAGNGVVIITTKRAADSKPGLKFDGTVGVRLAPNRLDMPSTDNLIQQPGKRHTDWVKMVTQNAFVSNISLSNTGSFASTPFRASLNYTHEDGGLRYTSSDRVTVGLNSDVKVLNSLTVAVDLNFAHNTGKQFFDGLNSHSNPYYMASMKAPWLSPWTSGQLNDVDGYGIGNPIAVMKLGNGDFHHTRVSVSVTPSWTVNDRWKLEGRVGYLLDTDNLDRFVPDLGTPDDELTATDGSYKGNIKQLVTHTYNRRTTFDADLHATFDPWKRGEHKILVTAGGRWQNDGWNIDDRQGYNTGSDDLTSIDYTDQALLKSKIHYLRWRSLGGYAHGDYSWQRRYFLNVTGVIQGSSRFGNDVPGAIHVGGVSWGLFPSVSAGWLLSDEEFFMPVELVNKLKVNLSYTVTGNDNLPLTCASMFFTSKGILKGDDIFRLARSGNEKLKWETTKTLRGGVEVGLFSDRITGSFDVFVANTDDLLLFNSDEKVMNWYNGGSMRNVGFAFTASSRLINTQSMKLEVGFMIGGYSNRITSLKNGSFVTDLSGAQVLTAVGNPVGTFYGFRNDDDTQYHVIGNPNPDAYGNITAALTWGRWSVNTLFTWSAGNDIYNGLKAAVDKQYNDFYYPSSPQESTPFRFNESMVEDGSYFKFKRLNVDYRLPLKNRYIKELTFTFATTNLFVLTAYKGADPEAFGGDTPMSLGIDKGLLPPCRSFHFGVKIPF